MLLGDIATTNSLVYQTKEVMNLIVLAYKEDEDEYFYVISPNASPNCEILDFKEYSQLKIQPDFILFIGCIWYGIDMIICNTLGHVASNYPNIKFYFKFIFAEHELKSLIPEELSFKKNPMILKIGKHQTTLLSTGIISKEELDSKIFQAFI